MYECLNVNFDNYLQIVSRKGKAEERRPLLILFSADAMACMFHAAGVASEKALDEKHYLFLKKLTQVCKLIYGQLFCLRLLQRAVNMLIGLQSCGRARDGIYFKGLNRDKTSTNSHKAVNLQKWVWIENVAMYAWWWGGGGEVPG